MTAEPEPWAVLLDQSDHAVYVYRTDRVRSLKLCGHAAGEDELLIEAQRIAARLNSTEGDER